MMSQISITFMAVFLLWKIHRQQKARLRVCFAEFAIFCLVEVILNFVFAGCIFILSSFAQFDTASMSQLTIYFH